MLHPWYWRSLPLENRTGSEVFEALFSNCTIATLLESPVSTSAAPAHARYSICAGSPRTASRIQLWTPPVGKILPFLRGLLRRSAFNLQSSTFHPSTYPNHLPFTGGWLGWLGYDLAWEIEALPYLNRDRLPFPVAYWYEPATFAVLDRGDRTLWLAATDRAALDRLQEQLETNSLNTQHSSVISSARSMTDECSLMTDSITFLTSQPEYEAAVHQVKKYISAGDIFQANLSLRFQASTAADSWSIYRTLQQINPSPFASYWQSPWGAVISCSPERLLQVRGQQAQTRPIAGTRSRGATPLGDRHLEQELLASVKERAEHIMLVDLERNDLGRVCQWGSVEVNELLTIERYSHVMHIVSNVIGTLKAECDAIDAIAALFPGGTITGCPKIRCLEIIEELEPVRRSVFYGSGGYLDQRGNLDLNIFIRTLLCASKSSGSNLVVGQIGAGIVADSDPEQEWYESLYKAEAQIAALKLVTEAYQDR